MGSLRFEGESDFQPDAVCNACGLPVLTVVGEEREGVARLIAIVYPDGMQVYHRACLPEEERQEFSQAMSRAMARLN